MFLEAMNTDHKLIIGLVHLCPLPGTPFYTQGDLQKSIDKALYDAKALLDGGADGCLIQSVDRVYPNTDDTDYARVAGISVVTSKVRDLVGPEFIIGAQLMWNCITPSIAACKAAGANFTRCSALVGSVDSSFGRIEANPLKVQEYIQKINAQDVELLAEISGYHHVGEYNKTALQQLASSAKTVGAKAVEVMAKDEAFNNQLVQDIKQAQPLLPVILGGGTDLENCARRLSLADGALVGSCFENGNWGGNIDSNTVKQYVQKVRAIEK